MKSGMLCPPAHSSKATPYREKSLLFSSEYIFLPPGAQIRMPQSNSRRLRQNSRYYTCRCLSQVSFSAPSDFSQKRQPQYRVFFALSLRQTPYPKHRLLLRQRKSYIHLLLLNYTLPDVQLRHKALQRGFPSLYRKSCDKLQLKPIQLYQPKTIIAPLFSQIL